MRAFRPERRFAAPPADVCSGRIVTLQGPPREEPECAPKLSFPCAHEIAFTAEAEGPAAHRRVLRSNRERSLLGHPRHPQALIDALAAREIGGIVTER